MVEFHNQFYFLRLIILKHVYWPLTLSKAFQLSYLSLWVKWSLTDGSFRGISCFHSLLSYKTLPRASIQGLLLSAHLLQGPFFLNLPFANRALFLFILHSLVFHSNVFPVSKVMLGWFQGEISTILTIDQKDQASRWINKHESYTE